MTRRIETRELIETVRRVAKEQKLYRVDTILFLNLAAAELERLAYPSAQTGVKGSVLPTTESVGGLAALSGFARPYPWCRQPSVCRGTCPLDPNCGE